MFTGLIEETGEITAIEPLGDSLRLTVRGPVVVSDATHGASIAVSGVCLTVIEQTHDSFTADVMAQSIAMSTLGNARVGTKVNLERAAQLHDRLGGHIVQGHIDGTGEILEVRPAEQWRVLRVRVPDELAPLMVNKGSITIDGVSLTLSDIGYEHGAHWIEVSLIPETVEATTLGDRVAGDRVNLETDVLARHVQRLLQFVAPDELPSSQPNSAPLGFAPNPNGPSV